MAGRRGDPIRPYTLDLQEDSTQRKTLYKRLSSPLRGRYFYPSVLPLPRPPVSGGENAPDFTISRPLRALVSPPRLPASCSGFHAPA